MILVILMMISCSNRLNNNLSKEQLQEYINELPDYPRRDTFTQEEQKRIASAPIRFKIWADEIVVYIKCTKYQECNKK